MNNFAVEQHLGPFDNCHPLHMADYPGVYFLCRGTSIVYVGKTKNISRRITQHVDKDFDTILVMRVPEELLTAIEMHWIQRLRTLNRSPDRPNQRMWTLLNRSMGRPPTGKRTITVRLAPETKRKLDRARVAAGEKNNSVYIEKMLLRRFQREGVE